MWILKSKGVESAFGGNEGYGDVIETHYVYDTTVKNHDRIREGEYVAIAGKKYIEGFARISSIERKNDVPKKRYRCPVCNTQEHYERKGVSPRFKCRNKHEFDSAVEENIVVTQFIASYKDNYVQAPAKTPVSIVNPYYVRRNLYYSIQAIQTIFLENEFPEIYKSLVNGGIVAGLSLSMPEISDYIPTPHDARTSKISSRITREGQRRFREALFRYYGSRCMVTGCGIPQAIEAGHLNPYRGTKDNHPANGILLRRDLHAIFDSNLFGIDPNTLTIVIHPSLKGSEYDAFHNKRISIPNKGCYPSRVALEMRWELFTSNL